MLKKNIQILLVLSILIASQFSMARTVAKNETKRTTASISSQELKTALFRLFFKIEWITKSASRSTAVFDKISCFTSWHGHGLSNCSTKTQDGKKKEITGTQAAALMVLLSQAQMFDPNVDNENEIISLDTTASLSCDDLPVQQCSVK